MCDDFEGSDDESGILEQSWRKEIDGINKDGFRTGIEVGQEESLQEGFDDGFRCSTQLLYLKSKLRGKANGKLTYNLLKPGFLSEEQQTALESLLGDIVELEMALYRMPEDLFAHINRKTDDTDVVDVDRSEAGATATAGKTATISEDTTARPCTDSQASTESNKPDISDSATGLHSDYLLRRKLKDSEEVNHKMCLQTIKDCGEFQDVKKLASLEKEYERILQMTQIK